MIREAPAALAARAEARSRATRADGTTFPARTGATSCLGKPRLPPWLTGEESVSTDARRALGRSSSTTIGTEGLTGAAGRGAFLGRTPAADAGRLITGCSASSARPLGATGATKSTPESSARTGTAGSAGWLSTLAPESSRCASDDEPDVTTRTADAPTIPSFKGSHPPSTLAADNWIGPATFDETSAHTPVGLTVPSGPSAEKLPRTRIRQPVGDQLASAKLLMARNPGLTRTSKTSSRSLWSYTTW